MSARISGPPDDDQATQVRDPRRAPQPDTRTGMRAVEHATPTQIDEAPVEHGTPMAVSHADSPPTHRGQQGGRNAAIVSRDAAREGVNGPAPPDQSGRAGPLSVEQREPLQIISMKDQLASQPRREDRRPLHVQLRSLAEVSGRNDTPVNLGRLAPPRDPRQPRASHWRANVLWGCVAIVLACGISLVVWFAAGR